VRFAPQEGLTRICSNLYLLRDTCNVYVLKNNDRALLIDFGSGHVLKLLGGIGVRQVDAILHTHHHAHQPTLVAPGHGKPFLSNKEDMEDLKQGLEKEQRYFSSVVVDPDCNFGLNMSWARLYPYQLLAKAGESAPLELRVRNYRGKPMHLEAALVLPSSWKARPEVVSIDIPVGGEGSVGFTVMIPAGWERSQPRVALSADVMADGRYLGEIVEGVVDIEFTA